jgi:enamine deaminase RidA (YjgF/YER057c/UK114 family)
MSRAIQPDGWKRPSGYANGILAEGRHLAIAGQVGWNERGEFVSDDFVEQSAQVLRNIVAIVESAGGSIADLTRLTWYVIDRDEYIASARELGRAYREVMGDHYPAMTLVAVSALLEARAKVEIEATAIIPR